MSDTKDIRQFPYGARVVLTGRNEDAENGKPCTILGALPNPSGRPENQWYDVRFDDNTLGRFVGRYLAGATAEQSQRETLLPAA